MTSELDIYRAANLVMKRHGADCGHRGGAGDLEGRDPWRRIRRAILVLQAPADGIRH